MCLIHAISTVLFITSKFISRSKEGYGSYTKTLIKTLRMILYMYAFINLQFKTNQELTSDTKLCFDSKLGA